jgi:4-amino-4-deoxy-L-arabinose transferase-like glycosyltransferase
VTPAAATTPARAGSHGPVQPGRRRRAGWLLGIPAVLLLFFFGLTEAGLLGPDEPRYASIGREMARSGDWITPRLWGEPWFEKPALLYWMIGLGNLAKLGPELAPRLPVVLVSLGFLWFFHRFLRREFTSDAAFFSTVILGTSIGWLAFSHLAVTDLPMSACFAAAMLLGMRWRETGGRWLLTGAAILLGLAVLAKGLVPLALALPMLWLARKRWRELFHPLPVLAFLLTAGPWYALCAWRNGSAFLGEFFWKHHFARLGEGVIHHTQPVWFYVPVLLAGLFPWTPLLALLARRSFFNDERRRFLLLWVAFGLVFFSAAANKLPGYLLPLFPAVAVLLGLALAEAKDARWVLAACVLLLLAIPTIGETLPGALAAGLSRTKISGWSWGFAITFVAMAALVWFWDEIGRRRGAVSLLLAGLVLCVTFLKVRSLPMVNRLASARPVANRIAPVAGNVCVEGIHRAWRYGLNYYTVRPLPSCDQQRMPFQVRQSPGRPPFVSGLEFGR